MFIVSSNKKDFANLNNIVNKNMMMKSVETKVNVKIENVKKDTHRSVNISQKMKTADMVKNVLIFAHKTNRQN